MELELKAEIREDVGKKIESLRKKGIIPAVVYGSGHKPVSIQVNYEEFRKIFEQTGESTLLKLKIGNEIKNVLINDISRDPVTSKFMHIDFHNVRMDKTIKAEVPLLFENEAPAVKNMEGVLVKNITTIEVEALPKDLPHEIKIDISVLGSFDKHIRARDLILPSGVKIELNPDEVIVSVMPPRSEEEIKATEEKPAEVIEPELVKPAASENAQAGQVGSEGAVGEKKSK